MATLIKYVAEMQGLYGPFTMAERVVQKIWLQRDFDQDKALLADGRTLEVRSTGAWNLLAGPDFRGAQLTIGGREVRGDVEVHFHAADWRAHGHANDRAYENVVLHVVLFPLALGENSAVGCDGKPLPTLVLLPLLYRDLEEYASDEALEMITARDEWRHFAELADRPPAELRVLLMDKARIRWGQKVYFARLRIEKLGWQGALHHAALEILGYRQNRAAMLAVADRYPLRVWSGPLDIGAIYEENQIRWQLRGVRPANHPRRRLEQYRDWVQRSPDWPAQVLSHFAGLTGTPVPEPSTKVMRQRLKLGELRRSLSHHLMKDAIGGTRLDNLICDGFLPLIEAQTGENLFPLWFHWFLGDVPDKVKRAMPKLGLADGQLQPFCQGYARGLLSWFLESEARASG